MMNLLILTLSVSCVTACRPGTYKASATDAYCTKCPPHSSSPHEQAVECVCEKGYYRAETDPRSMACTRKWWKHWQKLEHMHILLATNTCIRMEENVIHYHAAHIVTYLHADIETLCYTMALKCTMIRLHLILLVYRITVWIYNCIILIYLCIIHPCISLFYVCYWFTQHSFLHIRKTQLWLCVVWLRSTNISDDNTDILPLTHTHSQRDWPLWTETRE